MSTLPSSHPYNWSFHAIPGAFGLALFPHTVFITRLMLATKNQQSNAMPRTNLDTWKGKLPEKLWNSLARTRGAHLNAMEAFPLFAAAMVAGNVAHLPAKDMNNMALSYMAARVVHMALYMSVKNDVLAYCRTGAYTWSIAIPIMGLIRAGREMSAV